MAVRIVLLILPLLFLNILFSDGAEDNSANSTLNTFKEKVFIIGGDSNFPPYEFIVEEYGTKSYRGFNVDIMKAIALQTGIEIEFKPMVWADALKSLESGEIDAIEGIKYDESRIGIYDYSDEYIKSSQIIFTRRDTLITDISNLKGHRVAVQRGDVAYLKFKDEKAFDLLVTSSQEEAFNFLLAGQVTAVIGNKLVGQYILNQNGNAKHVKMVGSEIDPYHYGIAVKKGNKELLNTINSGLKEIKKNGTYDSIYKKWFGEPVDHPSSYYKDKLMWAIGVASLLLIGLTIAGGFGVALKKEVARRTREVEEINKALSRKDKMEALGNLVAGIAHEIRTPLTSIKTFTELLPEKYDNPDFRQKISRFVPQEVERVDLLVRSLLDYARPRKPNPELFLLRDLIDSVLILVAGKIERESISLNLDIDAKAKIFADKNQLQQVLINLLLNAIEALKGRDNRAISLNCLAQGDSVILVVQDNGIGISKEVENRIFDPFFTTKPDDGTGLGLAISYNLVKENNGRIWQESNLGEGAKFFVELPSN